MSLHRGCSMRLRMASVPARRPVKSSMGVNTTQVSARSGLCRVSRACLSSKPGRDLRFPVHSTSLPIYNRIGYRVTRSQHRLYHDRISCKLRSIFQNGQNKKFLSVSQMNDAWKMRCTRAMSTNDGNSGKSSSSTGSATTETAESESGSAQYGNPDTDEVQRMKRDDSGALSTFVVIKEKTEETISVVYIFGVIFCCFPYAIYLAIKSIFSKSSPEHVKDESFDMLREDHRVARAIGHDVMCKPNYNHATFVDNDGCDRLQVIYEVTGSKGDARVDVEMLKEGKEWSYQYVIVSTNYSVIKVLDNRNPVYANAAAL